MYPSILPSSLNWEFDEEESWPLVEKLLLFKFWFIWLVKFGSELFRCKLFMRFDRGINSTGSSSGVLFLQIKYLRWKKILCLKKKDKTSPFFRLFCHFYLSNRCSHSLFNQLTKKLISYAICYNFNLIILQFLIFITINLWPYTKKHRICHL